MRNYEVAVDELNVIPTFEDYFEKMNVSKEQKQARILLAEELLDAFLFVFAYAQKNKDKAQIRAKLQEELANAIPGKYKTNGAISDSYLKAYLAAIVASIADTTYEGIKREMPWDVSYDRAFYLASNEANTIENHGDYLSAKEAGYTQKTWMATIDERTRIDHFIMDDKTVGIDDYFIFPDCRMLFPHDVVNGTANQVANCRCSVAYSKGERL